jgi:hypothetical protein
LTLQHARKGVGECAEERKRDKTRRRKKKREVRGTEEEERQTLEEARLAW